MSLLGEGALVIWHDIAADGETEYNEWHSKEHMLERVGVPGFLRGYRYVARTGSPKYLNLYEVRDLATLSSQPYLDRLNDPTPWTEKALRHFRDNNRTLCRVVASTGTGVCAEVLTIQLSAAAGRGEALRRSLIELLPTLVERPGVLGAHYLEGDLASSRTETEEKRLRPGADAIADLVLLVGGYQAAALEEVRRTVLAPASLTAQGATDVQQANIYRLLHCITEADVAL